MNVGYEYLKVSLSKNLIKQAIKQSSDITKRVFFSLENEGISVDKVFSNKNKSEIISTILETKLAQVLNKSLEDTVINAQKDADSDIRFVEKDIPLEIKITSTLNAWTGGSLSNRPATYLLVSWGGNYDEFFVSLIYLDKEDWRSGGDSYYGTSFSKKELIRNTNRVDLLGNLKLSERGGKQTIKMTRERV